MTITISTDDPRSVKALALLPQARTWTRGRRAIDGRAFLIAPASKPGAVYFVDAAGDECTCPDRQTRRVTCKHMLAARLLLVERGGPGWGKKTSADSASVSFARAMCRVCTQPATTSLGECADCERVGVLFDGVEAIGAAFGGRSR